MEQVLRTWLLDNRPYTHLNKRIRQFVWYCNQIQPELSMVKIRKEVRPLVDKLMNEDVGKLWMRDRCFERVIRMYGQNDQRSAQWHAKRGEMITASEVYKIFTTNEARREVMLRKLEVAVPTEGNNPIAALLWGTRFEPIAKKIYEQRTNCSIIDVSCVQHPRYSFLGASPDGLIVPLNNDVGRYGRLVEFKCPISRAAKDEIPIAYVHQMQMQMECTGIDECEYVEFRFKQLTYTEWLKEPQPKGIFVVHEDGKVEYDVTEIAEDVQVIYWALTSIKEDFIKKDPNWISDHIEQLQSFWNEVLKHREAGTKPEPTPKVEVSLPTLDI